MLKAKQKQLNLFERIALVINCVAALCLVISYLAPYVNPAVVWPVAFFGMAYLPLLCLNAVCLVFWMIRFRKLAFISLICILIGAGLMGRNIGFRKQSFELSKASPAAIRIMTYNVYNFLNHEPTNNNNTNQDILQMINNVQPDIINMQEYFVHNSDAGSMSKSIKQAMQAKYYWFKPLKITPYDSTGLTIFSRYPIICVDTIPPSNGVEIEGIFADISRNGQLFRVYNVHLQSTRFTRDENAGLQNHKPNLHQSKQIGGKLKRAFIDRAAQAIALKNMLNECPYPYLITGDFNDTPLSFVVNHLQKGLKNAFREKGSGLGVTFYGEYPGFQLDYILLSRQFNVLDHKILRQRLSDHYPVLSDVELK